MGSFACSWATVTDGRAFRYASGEADVDTAQLTAILADPRIHVVQEADYNRPAGQLSLLQRTTCDDFCDQAGVTRMSDTETCEVMCDRLAASANTNRSLSEVRRHFEQEVYAYAKARNLV